MAIPVWDNSFFKYIVRDSWNRANAIASAAGGVLFAVVVSILLTGWGEKMLSRQDLVRAVEVALIGFAAIWIAIMLCRACWWPFHRRLAPHGGMSGFLRARLGAFMWPTILVAGGFAAFVLLTGVGVIWLSLQVLNGAKLPTGTPDTAASPAELQPDLTLLPPADRYTFKWDPTTRMNFEIQNDSKPLPPGQWANPGFMLDNSSRTAAADVVVTWQAEISNFKELAKVGRLAKYNIRFPDDFTMDMISTPEHPVPNFRYNPNPHFEYKIPFVARDIDLYLPVPIYPIFGLFIAAKMPDELGAKTEAFPIRVSVSWNVPDGGKLQRFEIKIRGVNTKASGVSDAPEVDGYLDFEVVRD